MMETKYIVILCDGMSDFHCKEIGGKTPMHVARKPNMNALAADSVVGLVKTVPDDFSPGSDVANLSVLGYNPTEYYTGRSPFEAASIGVDLDEQDVAIRANLVKLSVLSDGRDFRDATMISYCGDDIKTKDAAKIIKLINRELGTDSLKFYTGAEYRHCLVWKGGKVDLNMTPPHDITGKKIRNYVTINDNNRILIDIMEKSYNLLRGSQANCVWFWGEGKKANLPLFNAKTGLKGCMISAVDLLRGIGKIAGMEVIHVEGTTGYIDTNFVGEANAAIEFLKKGGDFAYIHVEAPDECGHRGELKNKIKAIERIDKLVLGTILEAYRNGVFGDVSIQSDLHGQTQSTQNDLQQSKSGDNTRESDKKNEEVRLKIMICPDHSTPLSLKTHTAEPVPFLLYDSALQRHSGVKIFDEHSAEATGIYVEEGHTLMERFISE